jgi:tetratricopeptide (TPR) repeat protein
VSTARQPLLFVLAALSVLCDPGHSQTRDPYSDAAAYVQQGRFDQAITILENLLRTAPRDLKARNLLGIALLSTGRKADAAVQFQKTIEIDPTFHAALRNLAVTEMELERAKPARAHFEQLLKLVPTDPVGHLYLGEIAFTEHRYRDAVPHYEQSAGQQFRSGEVTLHYVRSLLESGKSPAAQQVIDSLPAGTTAETHFEAGLLLAQAKLYAPAARQFALAQNGYPDPYKAGFNLVIALVESHDDAAAIRAGEQLIAQGHRTAELYNLLARAYESSGRTQQAYDALRMATQLDPQDETNYLDLMSLCLTHENWDLSLEIAGIALDRIPKSYRVRLQRGAVLALQGKMDDAEKEFGAAAKLAPQVDLPQVALALVRIDTSQYAEAADGLRARRASKDYRIHWLLAEALSRAGADPGTDAAKEAIAELQQAVRLNASAGPPRALLGKMLAKSGDAAGAAAQLEAALRIDPEDMTAAYQLAMIYRDQGKTAQAEALAEKVAKARSAPEPNQLTTRTLGKILRDAK